MTDRLWEYLEDEFKATNSDYVEIKTEYYTFVVEPIYNSDNSEIIDFAIYNGSYYTTTREEPDIWFWDEIDRYLAERGELL